MEDQVEEIKRKNDIVSVIGQYVGLKKSGKHHKGLCPFHGEKTPSFMVNEELGLYKCFGCGNGGDVIKFVMEIEGIEFREALERLADRVGIKLLNNRNDADSERDKMYEVLNLSARYYHWLLTEGKSGEAARVYLKERNISDKLIETFNIGFSLPSWDSLLGYMVKKKGFSEEMLERCGLVSRRNDGKGVYDKFRGRIMFPLQNPGGKVVGFSGRILPSLAKDEEPKYLNTPETELYHKGRMLYGFFQAKQFIREKKRAVLVEGQMDLISSFGAGVGETVAVGGTALTTDQVEMLARLAEKIYFSLDDDDAGTAAIKRSVEVAEMRGLGIKVVQIEGGKDPDEIARKYPNKWKEMVEKAVDVYEYVMDKAFKKYDSGTVDGVQKITEEVIPFLTKIENGVIREVWAKRLAEKLGVETRGVLIEIDRVKSGRQVTIKAKNNIDVKKESSKINKLMRRVVGSLLIDGSERIKIKEIFEGLILVGSEGKLLEWILKYADGGTTKEIIEKIPAELREVASDAYLNEGDHSEVKLNEITELSVQLVREMIKERKTALTEEMIKASDLKDEEKENKMFTELSELNKKERKLIALLG